MAELSFLTIIVSLAVCSLLIYAVFQYTKIRLTILEQSQKEQALILQQFIEESSTDIHRLYQLSTNNNGGGRGGDNLQPHDSIILEYANDFANHDVTTPSYTKPVTAYNEPHIIHLDTALFKNNNKSNLIEISSDSEDTTESESDSGSEGSDSDSDSEGSETGSEGSQNDSSESSDGDEEPMIHGVISEVIEVVCDPEPISDIKLVTVDLGAIQESLLPLPSSSPEHKNDVLSMLYKKAQETSSSEVTVTDVQPSDVPDAPAASEPVPVPVPAPAPAPSLSSMSVTELRHLLKEKYKNNPEKHPEIQKLKKGELIYALQTTQS
jgi:hypothetical protein